MDSGASGAPQQFVVLALIIPSASIPKQVLT